SLDVARDDPEPAEASPSRSSSASRSPVDAPDGTAARPNDPSASVTSTSTVGFPRESRISRACTFAMFTFVASFVSSVDLCVLDAADRRSSRVASAAIRLCLEAQRLFTDRPDERLVVDRDDDDAGVGDGVAAAIFVRVEPDERAAWNQHVAVDDRAFDARVAPDAHARHQDALLDAAEAVDAHVRAEHAA